MEEYRLSSHPGEINRENYLKINNTKLNAAEAAKLLSDRFRF